MTTNEKNPTTHKRRRFGILKIVFIINELRERGLKGGKEREIESGGERDKIDRERERLLISDF